MAQLSKIEWTESTWNPVTGCTKISMGCRNCYAERMAKRLQSMGQPNYSNGFKTTIHPDVLDKPLKWKKPQFIFVNSMSDLFHRDVPSHFIFDALEIMREAHWHIFQILTKRSDRLRKLSAKIDWPDNVWMGVSVETSKYLFRIYDLAESDAAIKFVSLEPLLRPIDDLPLHLIDWVIAGGESGPGARPIQKDWIRSIRDQCTISGVPFFFKQWGGPFPKSNGRRLDRKIWNQIPHINFSI